MRKCEGLQWPTLEGSASSQTLPQMSGLAKGDTHTDSHSYTMNSKGAMHFS